LFPGLPPDVLRAQSTGAGAFGTETSILRFGCEGCGRVIESICSDLFPTVAMRVPVGAPAHGGTVWIRTVMPTAPDVKRALASQQKHLSYNGFHLCHAKASWRQSCPGKLPLPQRSGRRVPS